ncbi:hypothetical protein HZ326_23480 [Fusarium oxysporum f. sp. albedinis]|nr:hypothetical protein HZ326_23480 [Fusarium oxysporum f. sp. albedinis]
MQAVPLHKGAVSPLPFTLCRLNIEHRSPQLLMDLYIITGRLPGFSSCRRCCYGRGCTRRRSVKKTRQIAPRALTRKISIVFREA